jgi:hypothetical protein
MLLEFSMNSILACAVTTCLVLAAESAPARSAGPADVSTLPVEDQIKQLNKRLRQKTDENIKLRSENRDLRSKLTGNVADKQFQTKRHSASIQPNPTEVAQQDDSSGAPSYTYLWQANVHDKSKCGGLIFVLRRDMDDLGTDIWGCPTPFDDDSVKGAIFSYGNNLSGHNQKWTVQGLAALLYSTEPEFHPELPSYSLINLNIGPYFSADTILNSSKAKSEDNTEVLTYGIIGSASFMPPHTLGIWHNFDVKVGVVSDQLTNSTSLNGTLQYSPASADLYFARPFRVPQVPLNLRLDPSLIAQYDMASPCNEDNVLQFNGRCESFRIGPQLIVGLTPNPSIEGTGFDFLKRLSASVTYHWAYETVGSRALPLFSVNVSYTLDEAKHFGLTASYQNGYDEDTGIRKNQVLVGLSAKM